MDVKKLYTPLEAMKIYNSVKIKFDPTSYSLKGNLITNCDRHLMQSEHICSFDYNSEAELRDAIRDAEARPVPKLYTGMSGNRITHANYYDDYALMCIPQDNLFIDLSTLSDFIDVSKIKTSNIMQTIVTMCVALNSQKSCAKDIIWLAIPDTQSNTYKSVHTLEMLSDALKDPTLALPGIGLGTSIIPTIAPTWRGSESSAKDPYAYNSHMVIDTLYSYLIAAFEVLWAYRKLPNEYAACFIGLCKHASMNPETTIFDSIFKLDGSDFKICTDVEEAIKIDDPELRYTEYQKIVVKNSSHFYNLCKEWYTLERVAKSFFNAILIAFMSHTVQLSLTYVRISTIRMLYNYAMTHKYLKITNPTASKLMSKHSSSSASESKSLFDFKGGVEYEGDEDDEDDDWDDDSGVEDTKVEHDHNAMFEALDSVKASFKDDRYTFDVEDIISPGTDAAKKAKYDAVANKVKLVNALLIKRIRAIKTYNVGGKNPGMSSGRVDRKTVYRYKYDPNIFYNNTYKTLESDLAFGIILDESGSMSGRGIEDGRLTMIVLHETLKALGINHSIIGHTSDGHYHTDIRRYQAFKEDKTYTTCKNYALVECKARWGNCDSGALYYMEKALDRVRNKDKICLIFSDGSPTECSGKELKDQVRHMERKGIKVIGIGIDFSSIAKYYTEYANGRNLNDMLNIVANILEEYVLKKKG